MVLKWFLVSLFALGALATASQVGRARVPMSRRTATIVFGFDLVMIVWIILGWPR